MLTLIDILLTLVVLPFIVAMVSSAPTRLTRIAIFMGTAFALFIIDSVVTSVSSGNDVMGLLAVIGAGVVTVVLVAPTDKGRVKYVETDDGRVKMNRQADDQSS